MEGKTFGVAASRQTFAQRLAFVVLACVLAFSTFASALTIAKLHDHDCLGDGCPTCMIVEASHAVLSMAATGSTAAVALLAALFVAAVGPVAARPFLLAETPVNLKVRLVI